MDTTLLSSTNANGLSVLHIANRVTLCVLQCNQRNDEITLSILSECLVLCRDVLEECGIIKLHLVAALFKCNAENLLLLYRSRHIVRVNLNDIVCTFTLVLQYLQSLWGIVRCNHTIADLTFDE